MTTLGRTRAPCKQANRGRCQAIAPLAKVAATCIHLVTREQDRRVTKRADGDGPQRHIKCTAGHYVGAKHHQSQMPER